MRENVLHEKLGPLWEYLQKIEYNFEENRCELYVGLPITWDIGEIDMVKFELVEGNTLGNLYKIYPTNDKFIEDDLIYYLEIVINTNLELERKRVEVEKSLELMKKELEERANVLFTELEDHKKKSFNSVYHETDGPKKPKTAPKKKNVDNTPVEEIFDTDG